MTTRVRCEVRADDHEYCLTHRCRVTDPEHPADFDGYVRRTVWPLPKPTTE